MHKYVIALLSSVVLTLATLALAEEASTRVDRMQALYLVSFFKFVRWPASQPADPLTVCFLRASAVFGVMQEGISQQQPWAQIRNHTVRVRLLADPSATEGCHTLYLDAETAAAEWENISQRPALLTVSDMDGFAALGGMIQLRIEGGQLHFICNKTRIDNSGIVIGAALARLADRLESERKRAGGS